MMNSIIQKYHTMSQKCNLLKITQMFTNTNGTYNIDLHTIDDRLTHGNITR
jgi:hypothetical protein